MVTSVNIGTGLFINSPTASQRATATQARLALGSLFLDDDGDGIPNLGVLPMAGATPFAITPTSASALTYSIGPGWVLLNRSSTPGLGPYLVGKTSTDVLTLAPADPTNSRIDLYYIWQPDPEAGDTAQAQLAVATGTPFTSGNLPTTAAPWSAWTLPQGAWVVGYTLVNPNNTNGTANNSYNQSGFVTHANPLYSKGAYLKTRWPSYTNYQSAPQAGLRTGDRMFAGQPTAVTGGLNGWNTWGGAVLNSGQLEYRWNGSRWALWSMGWNALSYPLVQGPSTNGSSSVTGRVRIVEGMCELELVVILTNAFAPSYWSTGGPGYPYFDLSNFIIDPGAGITTLEGDVRFIDVSAGQHYTGHAWILNSSSTSNRNYLVFGYDDATGTGVQVKAPANTVPFAWDNLDQVQIRVRFPILP